MVPCRVCRRVGRGERERADGVVGHGCGAQCGALLMVTCYVVTRALVALFVTGPKREAMQHWYATCEHELVSAVH